MASKFANSFSDLVPKKQAVAPRKGRFAGAFDDLKPQQTVSGDGKGDLEMSNMQIAKDAGRSFASGLRSGTEMLMGLPGDIQDMTGSALAFGARKMGASPETEAMFKSAGNYAFGPMLGTFGYQLPRTQDIQEATSGVVGPHYKPQTTVGEYANTVGEFAPSALAGPGGLARKTAMTVVPAVLSETAGQMTKGTDAEPYARAGMAIVGGGLAAGFKTPTNAKILKNAAKSTDNFKADTRNTYQVADQTFGNQTMKPQDYGNIVRSFNQVAITKGMAGPFSKTNKAAYPKSSVVLQDVTDHLKAINAGKSPPPKFGDLERLRQTLNDIVSDSKDQFGKVSRDGMIASQLINNLDSGVASSPYKEARKQYAQLRKTERIETAIRDAENASSSIDLAYKREFRKLEKEYQRGKLKLSPAEFEAVRRVSKNGSIGNLMEAFGRLGMTSKSAWGPYVSGMSGGGAGFAMGGPVGAAIGLGIPVAATVSRAIGTKVTKGRAQLARDITALGGNKPDQQLAAASRARNVRRVIAVDDGRRASRDDPAASGGGKGLPPAADAAMRAKRRKPLEARQ
jgi:hypothetical protein